MVPAILTNGPHGLGTLLYPVPSLVQHKVHGSITEHQESSELLQHPSWLRTGFGGNLVGDFVSAAWETPSYNRLLHPIHLWAALLTALLNLALHLALDMEVHA